MDLVELDGNIIRLSSVEGFLEYLRMSGDYTAVIHLRSGTVITIDNIPVEELESFKQKLLK